MKILLAPHNDDETLFCAFTLLRDRPHVIVCLRSMVQAARGITYRQREAETAAAMEILGCTWEQWQFPEDVPDWPAIEKRLRRLKADQVWAPLPEEGGHAHHNKIGEMAKTIWPNTVQYLTYTNRGKSSGGKAVPHSPEFVNAKLRALQCYRSQILEPNCAEHFIREQREYYA